MNTALLEDLRLRGYAPRTMLDVGAHVGTFTAGFLQAFPDCVPTLVEPNPFCEEALAQLPFERHAVAASSENGRATLFLTKEWLQSTGSSLYRENTAFFRDEVVIEHEVAKARLDDLFAGRRFDFVKIDTQGAELDVLMGGERLLRQADYILVEVSLVEFNAGAPPAEAVFDQLARMGFKSAQVTEFHRLRGVNDGGLLQLDFLFEREVRRPAQACRFTPLHHRGPLHAHLAAQQARCQDFTVLDLGGGAGWLNGCVTATLAETPGATPLKFPGALGAPETWRALRAHVARHGRFAYAVCDHALSGLADPAAVLELLPQVAEAGQISVPSRYLESVRPEGPYRGFAEHRWIIDGLDGDLVLAPKLPVLEHLALPHEPAWSRATDRFELQVNWRGAIAFGALAGPDGREGALAAYAQFFERP
jgi:FkbM family methyltransferase